MSPAAAPLPTTPVSSSAGGPARARLVLVTGAGRSGTSTIAGVFSRLGAHIPEPVIEANESNPLGFYESRWPVRFHLRLCKRADIEQTDGRPIAGRLMMAAVDDKARTDLRHWLAEQLDGRDLVVVKDPRAAWLPTLWADTAADLGVELSYLTMIRHPSEVVGSRATYYAGNRPGMSPREFAIWNLCGWTNQNLTVERQVRGSSRAFIPYVALLTDWREALSSALDDLRLPADLLTPDAAAEIDSFIEPSLRRHGTDWGDLQLPAGMIDVAERTWSALRLLAERHGHDADAETDLDRIADRYAALYADAQAISHDHASARARKALRQGRRDGRRRADEARATPERATGAGRIHRTVGRIVRRLGLRSPRRR